MDFLQLVKDARTCRRFDEYAGLPQGTLPWLVDCVRLSPCAKNQQALRFAAVSSPETREALFPALRWAGALPEWNGPEKGERPSGYLVMCAPKDAGPTVRIDIGIAGQTVQLAATSRGLASCMFLSFDPHVIAPIIDLPDDLAIVLVIALGKPVEVRRLAEVPANGCLNYWRDSEGVHYVPKRELKDILIREL